MSSTTVESDGQGSTIASTASTTIELHPTAVNALGVDTKTAPGNGDYSILFSDRTIVTSAALTGSWTWTLPAASSVPAGWEIVTSDAFGGCSLTYSIVVNMSGTDTINGSAAYAKEMKSPYAFFRFRSDGVSDWQIVGQFPMAGTPVGDADYTMVTSDTYVYSTATFTARRDWTLPSAAAVGTGWEITVADAFGGLTNGLALRVDRGGSDTINSTLTYFDLLYPFHNVRFRSDGVSGWQVVDRTIANGASGQALFEGETGWMSDSGTTWTYASATTFTVTNGQVQSYLPKGTKVSWKEGSDTKYGVVASSPSFGGGVYTVTLITNADYPITNTTLTNPRYSYAAAPQGFPTWFAFTTTLSGWSANPTTTLFRWTTSGTAITVHIMQTPNGTSNNAAHTATLPVAAATVTSMIWVNACGGVDNGTVQIGAMQVNSAATTLQLFGLGTFTNTASGGSRHFGQLTYQF